MKETENMNVLSENLTVSVGNKMLISKTSNKFNIFSFQLVSQILLNKSTTYGQRRRILK